MAERAVAGPPRRLREFAELPSVRTSVSLAATALGASSHVDAWADITNTVDGLLPVSRSASRPPPSRDPDADLDDDLPSARGERAHPGNHVLAGDLSLKTRALVVSEGELGWAAAVPQALRYAAVQAMWAEGGCEGEVDMPGWAVRGGGEEEAASFLLARALLHFRHPSTELMPSVASQWQLFLSPRSGAVIGTSTPTAPQTAALERLETWQAAFRSLFYGFRYRQVAQFYVVLKTTVMLFVQPDARDGNVEAMSDAASLETEQYIVVAQATPGLIGLLEDHGVPFTTRRPARRRPRMSGKEADVDIDNGDDYDDDLEPDPRDPPVDINDGIYAQTLPALLIQGAVNAQAAFNFVLDVGPRLANATDVPLLVSDFPFAGGEARAASLRPSRATLTAGGDPRHDLRIDGLLTSCQVRRLCESLSQRSLGECAVFLDTEPRAVGVNVRVGTSGKDSNGALSTKVVSRVAWRKDRDGPVVFVRDGRA